MHPVANYLMETLPREQALEIIAGLERRGLLDASPAPTTVHGRVHVVDQQSDDVLERQQAWAFSASRDSLRLMLQRIDAPDEQLVISVQFQCVDQGRSGHPRDLAHVMVGDPYLDVDVSVLCGRDTGLEVRCDDGHRHVVQAAGSFDWLPPCWTGPHAAPGSLLETITLDEDDRIRIGRAIRSGHYAGVLPRAGTSWLVDGPDLPHIARERHAIAQLVACGHERGLDPDYRLILEPSRHQRLDHAARLRQAGLADRGGRAPKETIP